MHPTEDRGQVLHGAVKAQDQTLVTLLSIDFILHKARFWHKHGQDGLKPEQIKVLNRLLDDAPAGFEGELSAAKYKGVAKVSKATATRHIADLLDKNCIAKREGGGRSTRYDINWPL
jgi:Fic family protein